MKRIVFASLAALTTLSGAAYAGNGNGNGWGGGHIPPGQAKKMVRPVPGERIPSGYVVIKDYDHYHLPAPGRGYQYVRYNDEIVKIAVDTAVVAATVGLVSSLLN